MVTIATYVHNYVLLNKCSDPRLFIGNGCQGYLYLQIVKLERVNLGIAVKILIMVIALHMAS